MVHQTGKSHASQKSDIIVLNHTARKMVEILNSAIHGDLNIATGCFVCCFRSSFNKIDGITNERFFCEIMIGRTCYS